MRSLAAALSLVLLTSVVQAVEPESATYFEDSIRPVLVKYCGECHGPDNEETEVDFLRAVSAEQLANARGQWSSAAVQLRNRTMPPADEAQPTERERIRIAVWIEKQLRAIACNRGEYAGSVVVRRLNRKEYDNTIRDLVGLQFDFASTFPVDGAGGEGFDNNGETLFLPPLLMERYLEAAQQILDAAVITSPLKKTFVAQDLSPKQEDAGETRVVLPGKEAAVLLNVYVTGNYTVRVTAEPQDAPQGRLALKIDGIRAHTFALKQADDGKQPVVVETVVRLQRGFHSIALHVPKNAPRVGVVRLDVNETKPAPSKEQLSRHQRLFTRKPGSTSAERRVAARVIVARFAGRAFRRPVRGGEITKLMTLYARSADRGDPFEESVKLAFKAVLVSPHFLFRFEQPAEGEGQESLTDYELASRLSYFLWAGMPDEELMQLADAGRLQDDEVLKKQVKRMLADPKARVFAEDFVGQWLGTSDVGGRVIPDVGMFKEVYDGDLGVAFRREVVEFTHHLLQDDRSLIELIDADYTFVNQRLARHYKMPGVRGNQFRKVALTDDRRGGVLGFAAVHLLTSFSRRTSPVLRGAWVLETLLGTPVPIPPPNVPPLPSVKAMRAKKRTLREQLKMHRENPTCAACHELIDPIGFGLDNFDVIGRWRDTDNGKPIDATGTMPPNLKFNGPTELKQIILTRKRDFIRNLSRKMLGYALGRSLVDEDQCTIETLVTQLERSQYSAHTLIQGIVLSTPFRRKSAPPEANAPAPKQEEPK
ncbi:MAG: hypothetical protein CMJ48_08405 [Planctomycetaceae bacterium]|nr:hypothetical protein [Planctomycetaceae bacterium]